MTELDKDQQMQLLACAAHALSGVITGTSRGDDSAVLVRFNGRQAVWWNPLNNNTDAMHLMVALAITPHFYHSTNSVYISTDAVDDPEGFDCNEFWGTGDWNEAMRATRRAIVRTAAEIGKSKDGCPTF